MVIGSLAANVVANIGRFTEDNACPLVELAGFRGEQEEQHRPDNAEPNKLVSPDIEASPEAEV
jgi:hypothetical protein